MYLMKYVWDYFDKYSMLCEMYDEEMDATVELILHFYPYDNSVQVINAEKGKNLLRRVQLPTLQVEMLQIGNVVNIFSKLLMITGCTPLTRRTLFNKFESTFVVIKPTPPKMHGKIISYISRQGFRIVRMKNAKVNKDFAVQLYRHIGSSSMIPVIIDYITTGEIIGLELVAPEAVSKFRTCLGATDPSEAAPGTIRALYGESLLKNVAHGCVTREAAAEMMESFFGKENGIARVPYRATYKNCTCCVIKPHAVIEGNVGEIVELIANSGKFYISAIAMFSVRLANALEFYEVYKGVLQEYELMSIQLAEGKCIAMEVKCNDSSVEPVAAFRELCGPRDPDICRQLYPDSIRAQFGKDLIHNAVHCTDLPEDGVNEVEYFFKLIAID